MVQAPGNNKAHSRKRLLFPYCLLCNFKLIQKAVQLLSCLFLMEIGIYAAGNHPAHAVRLGKLFLSGILNGMQIVSKLPAKQLCIGYTHIFNTQSIKQPGERSLSGPFQASRQITIRLFPEAIHLRDLLLKPFQSKQIRKFMQKSFRKKFFQRRLGQAVHVQGVPAHKQRKRLNLFGSAARIITVQGLYVVYLADPGRLSADRTDVGNFQRIAFRQILRNLWNDHVCLINHDPVSDSQL